MTASDPRLPARLQRHIQLLEASIEAKTRELGKINAELELRVEERTRELAAALARAEAAAAAKQTFLAHMSHELRTPLHAIGGMADVLLVGATGEPRRRIEVIRASAEHMLKLVNQVLDLSWLSRDDMPMHSEPVDIARIAEEVVSACDVPAQKKGLRVRACIGAMPPRLAVDAMRLREVLINFLGNAVKFTATGLVALHVSGREEGAEHVLDWVVEDTGCGMDAATVARVFEPFFQAKDTYRREHGGAGLGMAIARRIVQAMGGSVEVDSTPGVGTRIRFSTRHARPDGAAAAPADAVTGTAGMAGCRVLVIDDQEVNCLVAESALAQIGCASAVATGPEAGIDRALAEAFDLLLVDYHMPDIDGCEVMRRLRLAGVQTPALLATADLTIAAHEAATRAGFSGILGKPFSGEELRGRIAAVLAGRAQESASPPPVAVSEPTRAEPQDPAAPLFDVEGAMHRVGGSVRVLHAVVDAFLASLPGLLAAVGGGGDRRTDAHAIKGSAATVGAARLADLARRVELGDAAPLVSGQLAAVADATVATLRAWRQP